ncbi:hypothetical protein CPAV1605_817 [seawater metagenome]|uniref:Uncharacterized protein n=1 Tax=seawater metagenome TaxID=1561972 RepID=A0A5E8CLX3_9ZZZZ
MATNDGETIFTPSLIANSNRTSVFNCANCLDMTNQTQCQPSACQSADCHRCYCQGLFNPEKGTKAGKVIISVNGKNVPFGCSNCPAPELDQCRNGELDNTLISQNITNKTCSNNVIVDGDGNVVTGNTQTLNCDGEEMVNEHSIGDIPLPFNLTRTEVAIGGGGAAGLIILLLLL